MEVGQRPDPRDGTHPNFQTARPVNAMTKRISIDPAKYHVTGKLTMTRIARHQPRSRQFNDVLLTP